MVFGLVQHHKYNIFDIENLYPFERDIYYQMLIDHLDKVREEQKQKNANK
jgi:hypothetical protein